MTDSGIQSAPVHVWDLGGGTGATAHGSGWPVIHIVITDIVLIVKKSIISKELIIID
jgi:hypothetical protein